MTLQGQQVQHPPSVPSPTEHTERSGANSPSVFTSKHVSVKAGKEMYGMYVYLRFKGASTSQVIGARNEDDG